MIAICTIAVCVLALTIARSQNNPLTDLLVFPRLDSTHRYDDVERINSHYIHLDLTTSHGRQRNRRRYSIIDKQYLMSKGLIGSCGQPS